MVLIIPDGEGRLLLPDIHTGGIVELYIGGTDVAAIAGYSKFRTIADVWMEKKYGHNDFKGNSATEWGTRLEAVIWDKLVETRGAVVGEHLGDKKMWSETLPEWAGCRPDGIIEEDEKQVLVEIKTARVESAEWGDGKIPQVYYAQVQWNMLVLGIDKCVLAVLFSGQDYEEYEILADMAAQDHLLDCAKRFVESLEHDIAPMFRKHEPKPLQEPIRATYQEGTDDHYKIAKLISQYNYWNTQSKMAKEEAEIYKSEILEICQDPGVYTVENTGKVTKTVVESARLNEKMLTLELLKLGVQDVPAFLEKCKKTSVSTRVTIKGE